LKNYQWLRLLLEVLSKRAKVERITEVNIIKANLVNIIKAEVEAKVENKQYDIKT